MCGIFGYVGPQNAIDVVINGLKKLEYRGYDSAGLAGVKNGQLVYCKEVGKLSVLEEKIKSEGISDLHMAIGHTRWATHGVPSQANAHPHFDSQKSIAIVHNGIIENHEVLRNSLKKKGVTFITETDTEVVAHLVASFYQGDFLEAVQNAVSLLEGAYALALIHRDHPQKIIAVANLAPLVVGLGGHEAFISSDSHAFSAHTREVIFLDNSEVAVISPDKVEVFDAKKKPLSKNIEKMGISVDTRSKGNFEHYTLKEIHEQPQTIRNAMASRFLEDYGTVCFEEVKFDVNELLNVERILILGCGTSLNAGLIGASMFEDRARIPVQVEIASEFRYKNPIIKPGTFVIAISQSGETADTLAAVREVRAKGAKVLAICNVQGSSIVRESDAAIFYMLASKWVSVQRKHLPVR